MKANFGFPKRLINIYSGIKQRCYNPNVSGYKYCGKKGIVVCEEWLNDSKSLLIEETNLQEFINNFLNIYNMDVMKADILSYLA